MKNKKLEVGMSFDVVKILTNGNYRVPVFKIGGFTISKQHNRSLSMVLGNGTYKYQGLLSMHNDNEIKKIGKLTITKLK